MSFTSIQFAIFLPLVFLLYWFVFDQWMKNCKNQLLYQNLLIVVASYIFYGWWDWRFLILIALTSFLSWGSGILISRESQANKQKKAKFYLAANIIINLLILGVFKYFNFFVGSFCDIFGVQDTITLKIILPVGISFYTFQALSYSIDVYRKNIAATKDPVAFFAYVSFFPQLVAGPIERATNLLPQFEKKRPFDYNEAVNGVRRILWGLFKKMVVADNCGVFVNKVWDTISVNDSGSVTVGATGSTLALAAILFILQVYGDFSGYSDIAIGTARLFGIRLRDNFLVPYFSRSVAEFWKRWHISLNSWFIDYVYIPLGGSRNGKTRTILNTLIIFALSGLWHGANWTFVLWGLFNAVFFIPLILTNSTKKYSLKEKATWKQIPLMIIPFSVFAISMILFRAPDVNQAWHYMIAMLHPGTLHFTHRFFTENGMYPANLAIGIMFVMEWLGRDKSFCLENMEQLPGLKNRYVRITLLVIAFWAILYFRGSSTQFLYFQF